MAPYGDFSEEALAVWDFARCQRPDGTFYGTRGKCKAGKEVGAREKLAKIPKERLEKLAESSKLNPEQKKMVQEAAKKAKPAKATSPEKAAKPKKEQKAAKGEKKPKGKGEEETLESLHAKGKKLMEEYNKLNSEGKYQEATKKITEAMEINKKMAKMTPQAAMKKLTVEGGREAMINAGEGADERAKKMYDRALEAKITPAQRRAIQNYTEEARPDKFGYMHMNHCSRQPTDCPDPKEAKKFSKGMDSALSALPKNDGGDPFFRGIHVAADGPTAKLYETLAGAKPGQRFKDPAYGSYSATPGTAQDFVSGKRGIIFISRSKALTPIAPFSVLKDENEAVLPRGTEQTIRKVTRDGDILVVEVD